uniref:Ovule protein n=1 Tax=Romanomermis culicivorax TaxID=13658 RepID=A0A915HXD4_ROMCU
MKSSGSYSSKYTSSKRYVTSTEISYADHKAKSSYQKESTMEYTGPRGTTSSTKELITFNAFLQRLTKNKGLK